MSLTDFLPPLHRIAREAGAVILDIYHAAEGIEIDRKADDSPLTQADRAANIVICKALVRDVHPYPIISEENKAIPYTERRNFDRVWMVDPLDGTKEFIKRNGEFTVNIALLEAGRPVLGVVYTPVTDELFWAVEGEGAFRQADGKTERLSAATYAEVDKGLRLVCSRSHLNEATQAFVDDYTEPELVSKGSSLKFLLIAADQADIYPRLAPTMEWDTAAAQIILIEAGGEVVRAEDGTPLRYNKENLLNPHFIARGRRM